eukprot:scaffold11462_cov140-Isochrysis_galbana.AAC.9
MVIFWISSNSDSSRRTDTWSQAHTQYHSSLVTTCQCYSTLDVNVYQTCATLIRGFLSAPVHCRVTRYAFLRARHAYAYGLHPNMRAS